ncbi:tRNA (cytidine(34)-2'-O)-methyltransferase [Leptospira sp. GIMC2001]|uniref:tRNA (cytidine(34)-2'-O)-methyltransferase n=1 Tax=Leptospira sp. GIMC2001 TaxID=1513297 RepID=UPI00234B1AF1|nr:tRNA (cytidine(34)-2'-O)-methyltransferase [Leptospira sp. GIMC2001]WCL50389.1 tRNA (cytidine(34)-2'-O)-methyltransferase [Leptospira sp. GIMC2001]
MEVALFRPEIPPNTGNIGRLCVNAEVPLGIIGEPSFDLSVKSARRAGLDYWEHLTLRRYVDWQEFTSDDSDRIFLISKFGTKCYSEVEYSKRDRFVFGRETSGLPEEIMESMPKDRIIYIPMASVSRSINLSNAVAIILYEALRQTNAWQEFPLP